MCQTAIFLKLPSRPKSPMGSIGSDLGDEPVDPHHRPFRRSNGESTEVLSDMNGCAKPVSNPTSARTANAITRNPRDREPFSGCHAVRYAEPVTLAVAGRREIGVPHRVAPLGRLSSGNLDALARLLQLALRQGPALLTVHMPLRFRD